MSARIQVLLVVLATIVFAALNAATPWGPRPRTGGRGTRRPGPRLAIFWQPQ